jgi:LEA14-like dessication related protein
MGNSFFIWDPQKIDDHARKIRWVIGLFFIIVFSSCKDFKEAQVTGVKGFKLTKISKEGIEADVTLGIKNPNSMGFSVYPSEFDVTLNGMKMGKARLYKKVKIRPQEEKDYVFKLKSSFKDVNLLDATNLLNSKKRGQIELNGDLKAGKFYVKKRFPVNLKEKIDLSGLGY